MAIAVGIPVGIPMGIPLGTAVSCGDAYSRRNCASSKQRLWRRANTAARTSAR